MSLAYPKDIVDFSCLFSGFPSVEAFLVLVCYIRRIGCFQEVLDDKLLGCCFIIFPEVKKMRTSLFQMLECEQEHGKHEFWITGSVRVDCG